MGLLSGSDLSRSGSFMHKEHPYIPGVKLCSCACAHQCLPALLGNLDSINCICGTQKHFSPSLQPWWGNVCAYLVLNCYYVWVLVSLRIRSGKIWRGEKWTGGWDQKPQSWRRSWFTELRKRHQWVFVMSHEKTCWTLYVIWKAFLSQMNQDTNLSERSTRLQVRVIQRDCRE